LAEKLTLFVIFYGILQHKNGRFLINYLVLLTKYIFVILGIFVVYRQAKAEQDDQRLTAL